MVSSNPLFRGVWTLRRFNATIVNDVWPEVVFFSLIATMVALVSEKTDHQLGISTQLLTVLGTVLGLVISFRTSSAYERYQDGRKLWTNITIATRNVAEIIWIYVPNERKNKDSVVIQTELKSTIEKKSMINLLQAFSVAVKHFLRGEPGVYYQDLYPLICFLPRYASVAGDPHDLMPLWEASEDGQHPMPHHKNVRSATDKPEMPTVQRTSSMPTQDLHTVDENDLEKQTQNKRSSSSWFRTSTPGSHDASARQTVLPIVQSHRPLKPARNPPPASFYDYLPVFRFFKFLFRKAWRKIPIRSHNVGGRDVFGRRVIPQAADSNVPVEICLFLSSYAAFLVGNSLIPAPIMSALFANLSSLQDTMSNLDRVRNTPLPFAYQAHLRMSLWHVLHFIFEIYDAFGYLTIPATAFASFLLLGFLEIGQEIENPFNYDLNDLDLDQFCNDIHRELHEITAHTVPKPADYVFSPWNQPFAPADRRTAEDLTKDPEVAYRILNAIIRTSSVTRFCNYYQTWFLISQKYPLYETV
ncbi:hypothetical protein FISHEDRAFT_65725 [Fistulina hepatica ATCC 64428]|uniref:Uncharacterized protein n=1 Tax=Fistulina hepatica ATCC 64428 TaxID=1128425 RepID=A0A0D7ADF4_9AGAR|nr:hypothetical protein FISHEDRAFT_65725 [Fistulina hepatica ATCC 64428]